MEKIIFNMKSKQELKNIKKPTREMRKLRDIGLRKDRLKAK